METPSSVAQPSFTTGELSPSLYGRIDIARYYTALKTCRNFIVRPYGGVINRPGTYLAGEVKDHSRKVRLVDFQFSNVQTYAIEFGHYYLRFYMNGEIVVYPDGHAQAGQIVEVVTPWAEEDLFLLKMTQSADVMTICHVDFQPRQLSRYDHHDWTLTEFANIEGPFLDINTDETKTLYSSGVTGSVTLTAGTDLFTEEMVGRLFYIEQSSEVSVSRWEVQKGIELNDIRRAGANYYQAMTAGETGTVRPSTVEGAENDGDPGVTWRYLHSGNGIVRITGFSSATSVTATVLKRLPDSVMTGDMTRTVTNVVAGSEETWSEDEPPVLLTPDVNARVTCPVHGFSGGDYVTISGVVGMTGINVTAQIIVVDINTFDLVDVAGSGTYESGGLAIRSVAGTHTFKWAIEAWGGEQGFPATTVYHQQRQIFGGSQGQPQAVWESRTAGYLDFGTSVPMLDDDAITFALNSRQVNEIRHFVEIGELVCLTSFGAWKIIKDQNNPIPEAKFQAKGGASHVPPVVIGDNALFVQEKGGAIRALSYFFDSDSYRGRDLTITASHLLFGRKVVDWAFQEVPFSCVWIVTDDGQLLGLTYMPDQEVIGWHRHDTDGFFESVTCISDGNEDVLYAVIRRTIAGQTKRYIERFTTRFFTDPLDAFFVDCGLTYDGRNAGAGVSYALTTAAGWTYRDTLTFATSAAFFSGTSDVGDMIVVRDADGEALRLRIMEYVSASSVKVAPHRTVPDECKSGTGFDLARDTFSGLSHLEGKEVAIFADGNVAARQTVSGGSVALQIPAVVAHVGLPIQADIETLDLSVQGQSIQDRRKLIGSVSLIVEGTRGLFIGPDPAHLLEVKPQVSWQYDQPVSEVTGAMSMNISASWSTGGRLFIRQDDPLPASILAAIPNVVVSNG